MKTLERIDSLLLQEYSLSKEIKSLKDERFYLFCKCEEVDSRKAHREEYSIQEKPHLVCANYAYIITGKLNKEHYPDKHSYKSVFADISCESCLKAEELKCLIKQLNIKRGIVKTSITKYAKTLYLKNKKSEGVV